MPGAHRPVGAALSVKPDSLRGSVSQYKVERVHVRRPRKMPDVCIWPPCEHVIICTNTWHHTSKNKQAHKVTHLRTASQPQKEHNADRAKPMLSDSTGSTDPDTAWRAPQGYLRMLSLPVGGLGKHGLWPFSHTP